MAAGWLGCARFVDLQVHFRDPGLEYKETIETGCLAAAHAVIQLYALCQTQSLQLIALRW